jgi:hypothetical protein
LWNSGRESGQTCRTFEKSEGNRQRGRPRRRREDYIEISLKEVEREGINLINPVQETQRRCGISKWGISWLVEKLSVSKEGLCPMELSG